MAIRTRAGKKRKSFFLYDCVFVCVSQCKAALSREVSATSSKLRGSEVPATQVVAGVLLWVNAIPPSSGYVGGQVATGTEPDETNLHCASNAATTARGNRF